MDEIRFSDCPAAVQKTFLEESNAVGIGDVGKETKFGITIYAVVSRIYCSNASPVRSKTSVKLRSLRMR